MRKAGMPASALAVATAAVGALYREGGEGRGVGERSLTFGGGEREEVRIKKLGRGGEIFTYC